MKKYNFIFGHTVVKMIRYTLYGYDPRYADTSSTAVTEEQDEAGDWVRWEDVEDILKGKKLLLKYVRDLSDKLQDPTTPKEELDSIHDIVDRIMEYLCLD